MSGVQVMPLSSLAPVAPVVVTDASGVPIKTTSTGFSGLGTFLLWFIIIAIVVYFILYAWKPSWVLGPGGLAIDTGKILWVSIVIALVIVLLIWLLRGSFGTRSW